MLKLLSILSILTFFSSMSNQLFGKVISTSNFDIILETNDVNCKGDSTGSANVIIENGIAPFLYMWSTSDTLNHVENLPAGNYSLIVFDSIGCTDSISFTIIEPEEVLEVSLDYSSTDCSGFGGTIFTTVTGGMPPYSYDWEHGSTSSTSITCGFQYYFVTVTDMNNCSVEGSVYIPPICNLEITYSINGVSCSGGSDGTISMEYTGCVLPGGVNFCISGFGCNTGGSFSNLPAGDYSLYAYTGPCNAFASATIEEPNIDTLSYDITNFLDINCSTNYGQVELEAVGGISPYSYDWSDGNENNLNDSLTQGIHYFSIIDSMGCTVSNSIEIGASPSVFLGNDTIFNFTCPNNIESLEIIPIVEGTSINYIFEWSNDENILSSGDFSSLITDSAGIYIFTAFDTINNCSVKDSISILNNINFSPDSIISSSIFINSTGNQNNGSITSNISGGTPPYSYEWNTGQNTPDIFDLFAGNYLLSVNDYNGCVEDFWFSIDNITNTSEQLSNEIKIYPNPAAGLFNLDLLDSSLKYRHVKIYDSQGSFISQVDLDNNTNNFIDLRKFANGIYFVSVEFEEGMFFLKRVVKTD